MLMESIVRPHLPNSTNPATVPPKCQQAPANTVIKFAAPAGLNNYQAQAQQNQNQPDPLPPPDPPQPDAQKKTINSAWSYAYKKYMTKKEKEQDKCGADDKGSDRIVGGQDTGIDTSGSGSVGNGGGDGSTSDAGTPENPPSMSA